MALERALVLRVRDVLARSDGQRADLERLASLVNEMGELFLLVVVGEYNSGKSTFINALLGDKILEEGVTPTTTRVHLIRHGPEVERTVVESALDVISAPVELLRDINIVDTPGTNAIHREHEAITREFVPRSDMVLFVTSADRPFTESERAFLQGIREWGKKVVIIINKIDILESVEEVRQVEAFVADNARSLLGFTPDLFPVASRLALRAKQSGGDPDLLAKSRFDELERYIVSTLDEKERVRLKLLNPMGVAEHLASRYLEITNSRLDLLKEDFAAIEDIEQQLAVYKEDMAREFRFRLSDVDKVLHEFENRGVQFFDETMRLTRVFDLVNRSKMKAEFEQKVVGDAPQLIERRVSEIIDWIVAADLRQWQAVMEHLAKRRDRHADRIVGRVGGSFDFDRTRLLDSVGRAAQRSVETFDKEAEANRLADSVQTAVAGTALAEVTALGLGAIVTHIAVTAAADFTGILAAGTVAVLGLFIIPNRRHEAKKDLREKIEAMRVDLMTALTGQFDHEIEGSLRRIDEAIAPYTRFVRSERDRLNEVRGELHGVHEGIARLRTRVEAL